MLHRFKKTRNASIDEILTDETQSNVEAFGEIEISIPALENEIWKMILKNVCYISNFMINIVVSAKLRAKKMYFDDQRMRLHVNGRTLDWVKHTHDHDVLKNNTTVYTPQAGYSTNQIKNADEDFAAKSTYALIKQSIKSGTVVQ